MRGCFFLIPLGQSDRMERYEGVTPCFAFTYTLTLLSNMDTQWPRAIDAR